VRRQGSLKQPQNHTAFEASDVSSAIQQPISVNSLASERINRALRLGSNRFKTSYNQQPKTHNLMYALGAKLKACRRRTNFLTEISPIV